MKPTLAAIVLCGGASRRMGTDKALLDIDGTPLLSRVVAALVTAGAGTLVLVGTERPSLQLPSPVVWTPDSHPHAGPLAGLIDGVRTLEGLGAHPETVVLLSACDHPALDPAELRDLVQILADDPAADAVVPEVHGRSQPLHAAYRLRVGGHLTAQFGHGERSLLRALAGSNVRRPERTGESYLDVDDPHTFREFLAGRHSATERPARG